MIHPNAGHPILLLIMAVIIAWVVYTMFTAKPPEVSEQDDDDTLPDGRHKW